MKELGKKIWEEPAAAIGLLVSLILLVGALLGDTEFDWESILVILSPLLTGLGIRPFVKPTAKEEIRRCPRSWSRRRLPLTQSVRRASSHPHRLHDERRRDVSA